MELGSFKLLGRLTRGRLGRGGSVAGGAGIGGDTVGNRVALILGVAVSLMRGRVGNMVDNTLGHNSSGGSPRSVCTIKKKTST